MRKGGGGRMAEERDGTLLPQGHSAVMICIDPELVQSMADVSVRKQRRFQELLEAAEEGDLDAQHRVAMSYCNGTGGARQDEDQAFRWFRRAAEEDYIPAQYGLGLCYIRGIGTERDLERGIRLLEQAGAEGYPPALCELGLCYEVGAGVAMDKERAAQLYREAAEQEYAPAQCNLGFCYYRGIGVEENDGQALHWFEQAAERDYPRAQQLLGECYDDGVGVEKDEARAAELVGNVGEGREAHGVGYVAAKVDFVDQGFVAYQGVDVDAKIGGHAIYCVVAFRMHGGIVEGIRSPGDAQESRGLLKCFFT